MLEEILEKILETILDEKILETELDTIHIKPDSVKSGQNIFDNLFLEFGKYDQSDKRFSKATRGNQCTCNCLVYLAMAAKKLVKHLDLNSILDEGDKIYMQTVQYLKKTENFQNMLLTLDEIPSTLDICNKKLKVDKKDVLFGAAIQTSESVGFL
ncbi:unnamed protein product [Mytilus coruscus]|uniref:Peptidase C76 domain-containing protein n=1 Tax=Mytilus coruscus TaxID=42192 RepID=A0A6J8F0S6_MYTCO|nr:unnamed protein product [Mytilus coruscus]